MITIGRHDAESKIAAIIDSAEDSPVEPIDLKDAGLSPREALFMVCDRADIWRSPEGETFATVPVGNHVEHHAINSKSFRDWMIGDLARTFTQNGRTAFASKPAVEDALRHLEARGHLSTTSNRACLRVSEHDGAYLLDIGSPDWSAIEVNAAGWRMIRRAPVPILRGRRTNAFPLPRQPGDFGPLRRLLSHLPEDDFIMFVAWCLGALLPDGPYPILILSGQQGAGKSTLARLARAITDPVVGDLLQPPGNDRDLVAAAKNYRVLAFDNISGIKADLADSLCRLATGAEIGGRTLFTDNDSASFSACRPMILNGIPDLAARGDLADRSIIIRLDALESRMTERDWAKAVQAALPSALGALLGAMATGLKHLHNTPTPEVRMADFATFVVAAEPALPWPAGRFLEAYQRNRQQAMAGLTEGDLVAKEVQRFTQRHLHGWSGLVSELYEILSATISIDNKRSGSWPGNARWFSGHLRRLTPGLRLLGVGVREHRDVHGVRIYIEPLDPECSEIPTPVPPQRGNVANVAILRLPELSQSAPAGDAKVANGHNGMDAVIEAQLSDEDRRAAFDERAGIAQFDGGLSREEAESIAVAEVPLGLLR